MLKLIKLEWKKNRTGTYMRNAVILAELFTMITSAVFLWKNSGIFTDDISRKAC